MSKRNGFLMLLLIVVIIYVLSRDVTQLENDTQPTAPIANILEPIGHTTPIKARNSNTERISTKPSPAPDIGIFECIPDFISDQEVRNARVSKFFDSLASSNNEADALYYALYAEPPQTQSRLDLLFDYDDKQPSSPIISTDLISLCANSADKRCNESFVEHAISADRDNGASWMNAILFYAAKGNDKAVINAIDTLAKTSLFNERFGEKALLYTQSLESSATNQFNANAVTGIAKSASSLPTYSSAFKWCKQHLDQIDKANACLTLGEQLDTRSKTLLGQTVGITLQSMVYEAQGNDEAVRLLKNKQQVRNDVSSSVSFHKASLMMMLDERLLRHWLDNLDFYGEVESQRILVEETKRLYEENENQLCTLIYQTLSAL